ncbi:MAG: MerR family transcriptional regulator [Robiginitomaculum sp.]|nr:MAG: MerR family transcriptional regulator [Robiginitomaculum sp.]
MDIPIGVLARRTGAKVQTIRYYEQIGLMDEPVRTYGGQRRYDEDAVKRLSFIRHARALGFSLEQISNLLALADNPQSDCSSADSIARAHLQTVKAKIAALNSLKRELARMVDHCDGTKTANCRVIETLANHDLCASQTHGELK